MFRRCGVEGCENKHHANGWCSAHNMRWKRNGSPTEGLQRSFRHPPKEKAKHGDPLRFFLEDVMSFKKDECLFWPFAKSYGYAFITIDGKNKSVSRLICEYTQGPPVGKRNQAAHSCGKGHLGCVSQMHLSWKTREENEADKLVHGTHNRGERCGSAKLTEAKVRMIRELSAYKTQKELSAIFGVGRPSISMIVNGKRWKNLSEQAA